MAYRVYDEFGTTEIEHQKNGDLMVCVEMPVDTWLIGYLLSFGAEVEIIEPKYLKSVLAAQAQAIYKKINCSKSRNGKFRVKRKTSKKKFAKKCKEVHRKIAEMRTMQLPQIIKKLNEILVGYYHYYGITDNYEGINDFCFQVRRSLFHWLNRRSQKKSYTWEAFNTMLKVYPLARPKIYVSIYG